VKDDKRLRFISQWTKSINQLIYFVHSYLIFYISLKIFLTNHLIKNDERHQFKGKHEILCFLNNHSNSIFLCFKQITYSTTFIVSLKMDLDNNNNNNNSVSSEECVILPSSPVPSASSTETEALKRSTSKVKLSQAEAVSKINNV